MKIIGLFLVVFYAILMLFALWKQTSRDTADSTSATEDTPPGDGPLPASGTPPVSLEKKRSPMKYLPSICIGTGCLLLLAYALLSVIQSRSMLPVIITGMAGISAGTLLNGIRRKKVHLLHHVIRLLLETALVIICQLA